MRESTEVGRLVGGRMREMRIEKGLTQAVLAKELGCHVGQISRYETGVIEMNYTVLRALSKLISADMNYLLGVNYAEQDN